LYEEAPKRGGRALPSFPPELQKGCGGREVSSSPKKKGRWVKLMAEEGGCLLKGGTEVPGGPRSRETQWTEKKRKC